MRNFITESLTVKLVILFLLVGIIPIAIVGYAAWTSGRQTIEKDHRESLTAVAEARESELILYLKGKTGRVLDLSTSVTIRDSLEKISQKGPDVNEATEKLNKFLLEEKKPLDPEIYEMFVIDLQGKVVSSTDKSEIGQEKSSDPYFVEGKKGIYVKNVYQSKTTGKIGFAVSAPLLKRTTKELMGVVVNRYELTELNAITINREGLGETGESYIVNKDGLMITESRFVKDAVLKEKVDTEPVRLFQAQKKIMIGIYPDYRGMPVLGASMGDDIEKEFGLGWTILAEKDAAEAFAPIKALAGRIIWISVLVGLLAALIAYLMATAIANPVKKISEIATKVAEGDLTQLVEVKSKDEVGILANAFNQMIVSLKKIVSTTIGTAERVSSSSQQLSSTAQAMNATTEEIASTVQQIAKGMEQQAQRVEETSKVMEKMNASVELVAQSAGTAATASLQSNQTAQSGGKAAKEAVAKMHKIYDSVSSSSIVVKK